MPRLQWFSYVVNKNLIPIGTAFLLLSSMFRASRLPIFVPVRASHLELDEHLQPQGFVAPSISALIMTLPTTTKCWVMARKPTGLPTYSGETPTFVLTTRDLPELKSGQVLVEALYISNDPAQRTWMSSDVAEKRHYSKPLTSTPCSSERHPCAQSRPPSE